LKTIERTTINDLITRHRIAGTSGEPPVGRPGLSRRRVIQTGAGTATAIGLASVGARTFVGAQDATASPSATGVSDATGCTTLTPEMTEGPYYVDEALVRSDIVEDREGVPLDLTITVMDTVTCAPLANAAVEIWHCDARGYYSGVSGNNPGSDSSAEEVAEVAGAMWLRGVQITNADGNVTFRTIFPGWYVSRTIHIHMKVFTGGNIDAEETYENGTTHHTGQLFFEESLTEDVLTTDAYANRPDTERTTNDEDGILGDHEDEPGFIVTVKQVDEADVTAGLVGMVQIGVDPTADNSATGGGMGGSEPPAGGMAGPGGEPPAGGSVGQGEETASPSPAAA
jgi:protocatechuate 3,4-dioxygenase beta subunit